MADEPCYGFNNHRAKVSSGSTMNPQQTGTSRRLEPAGAGAALCLEEELAAAIHGAFECAVEIAVREVTKLVGKTGNAYEDMRRENESLRQRLKRAEALLDSACVEERGGGSPPTKLVPNGINPTDPPPQLISNGKSRDPNVGHVNSCMGVRGDAPLGGPSCANQLPDPQPKQEEQRSGGDVRTLHASDAACGEGGDDGCAVACDVLTREVSDAMSRVCVVRVESMEQSCREVAAQHYNLPPLPSADDEVKASSKQFTVKQERPEEEGDDSACCLDSIKIEDFSPECMTEAQLKMLEEWKPEVLDIQCQDSDAPLARLALDHQSLSSDFPKIFQLAEPAPVPEATPRDYVHVRVGRSVGHAINNHAINNHYACKSCGQTFHLPSLLRRHHGQCQQKPQQCYQQPVNGSKRTRLQLYPPGCSPFRCTECNREFNRMENLKTHLRIHTGERPYTCSVCSKCFRHSGALTRHFRIHTGEKPYVCGQCGKSFRNCGGLKFHQRSHRKQLQ